MSDQEILLEDEAAEAARDLEARLTTPRSLLAIDVGAVNTRALLFDVVEGRYRFLAAGVGPTTAGAPMHDAREGVRHALDILQRISGRVLTSEDEQLIIPSTRQGAGADNLASTLSGAPPLKAVAVGLLERVSLESALNLLGTTYVNVVESVSLARRRRIEQQVNTIVQQRPDLVVVAGGTDGGATRSVLGLVNALGMAISLVPPDQRPDVLFAGNRALADRVSGFLEPLTPVHVTANVRPALTSEQLGPAETVLADIFRRRHASRILGLGELNTWSGGNLQPTAMSLGRITRFLSVLQPHGALAVDVGASATAVAAGFKGDLRLRTFAGLGVGGGLQAVLHGRKLEQITRWLPLEIDPGYVLDYIQNKILMPATLPAERDDLAIEQALAREVMRMALEQSQARFPRNATRLHPELLPVFDATLVSGAAVAHAPTIAQSLLMILDAIEPTGVQQVILDKNNLAPALGAAAPVNPAMVIQLILDPISFLNLGYVIAPVVNARPGTPVLRIRIQYETGHSNTVEVAMGDLRLLPLPAGRRARLEIDCFHRADVGAGPGRSLRMERPVIGGPFGVVVDARGRPLRLPADARQRLETVRGWHLALGR
jgi:hypothetical protein